MRTLEIFVQSLPKKERERGSRTKEQVLLQLTLLPLPKRSSHDSFGDVGNSAEGMVKKRPPYYIPQLYTKIASEKVYLNVPLFLFL